jgi:uridine monophosphate synthetase
MTPSDRQAHVGRELAELLHRIGAVRFGDFTLKDGRRSPFYLDLRGLISHPEALARVARAMLQCAEPLAYDRLAGLPYAGLPIAVAMSLIGGRPMIYARKEAKDYGTKRLIEGEFAAGERALLIDDVVTSGGAKLEALAPFRAAGLVVEDVLVVIDREDRGAAALADAGLRLHSVLKVRALLEHLRERGAVPPAEIERALAFLGGRS